MEIEIRLIWKFRKERFPEHIEYEIKAQLNSNFTPYFLESVHFSKSEWQ
jgi:hypothetical protein